MSLPNRFVVLDDADERIRYEGSGWVLDITGSQDGFGTYGSTYNHTLHTTQANDSLALSFSGSSLRVYGTINLSSAYNSTVLLDPNFKPPWECFIDNISIGSSTISPYHENNWLFCKNDHLNDGSHELTLKLSMKQGTTFWVDYIQYSPTQNPIDGSIVLVDNMDPALSYDSSWQGVDSLANMTNTQGGQVTFNFTGTQLSWMGYIPVSYPGNRSSASYSIDNGTPTSFDLVGHATSDGTSIFNPIFFTTPELAPGSHRIVVTYNGNPQRTPLTLDYLYLTTATTGNSTSSSSNGHHKAPVGAIAGGVVGGIAVIVLLLGFLWWRRRTNQSSNAPPSSPPHNAVISPFSPPMVQPFQASSTGLLSSESLARTQSDPDFDHATSDRSLSPQARGYISGALAQTGDFKKVGGHAVRTQQSFNALGPQAGRPYPPDEVQPPQYSV